MNKIKMVFRKITKKIVKATGANKMLYAIKTPFVSRKIYGSVEEARSLLEQFSPCPQGTSLVENAILDYEYDLQIIVPAYNVEKYIEECINSILEQKTKYSYKIVIINDGSIDRTKEILEQYSNNSKIDIIHQENKGFSGARNKGLAVIKSKYIAFVDSDDKLAPNAIESLMNVAINQNADIVEGGFYRLECDKISLGYKHKKNKMVNAISYLKGYPWGKVFKSSLFESIHFPENFWFEDSIGAFLLYPKADSAFVIPDVVYIYRNNSTGITNTAPFKPKCIDTYWITELLLKEQARLNIVRSNDIFESFLKQIILNCKRTKNMPIGIQEKIFICTRNLLNNYFSQHNTKRFKQLTESLQNSDFGKYKCFCEFYI